MKNTLFDDNDKNKRKYTCFCCGIQFTELEDMKIHILEKHEENRDYIVCPLKHCGYPVRCLRQHFKIRHPNFEIPKNCEMRATIWKDFNEKKPKTRKPKFREGYYQSTKMGKSLHYRSGYEAKLYEYLDADIEVASFDVEPFEIGYSYKGEAHNYIPDLIVHYTNGKTEIIEIKPSSQTALEKNQNKWHAAAKACKTRGWEFTVITEIGLDRWHQKIKNQFHEANIGK